MGKGNGPHNSTTSRKGNAYFKTIARRTGRVGQKQWLEEKANVVVKDLRGGPLRECRRPRRNEGVKQITPRNSPPKKRLSGGEGSTFYASQDL